MFGLGAPELIVILVIALLVFGPNKLPELASSLGKTIREFKESSKEFNDTVVAPALAPIQGAKKELENDVINPIKDSLDLSSEMKDINDTVVKPINETINAMNPKNTLKKFENNVQSIIKDDNPNANVLPDIPEKPESEMTEAEKQAAIEAQLREEIKNIPPDIDNF